MSSCVILSKPQKRNSNKDLSQIMDESESESIDHIPPHLKSKQPTPIRREDKLRLSTHMQFSSQMNIMSNHASASGNAETNSPLQNLNDTLDQRLTNTNEHSKETESSKPNQKDNLALNCTPPRQSVSPGHQQGVQIKNYSY